MNANDHITLREHFDDKFQEHRVVDDARFAGLENQLNIKISSLEKATTVAAGLMEKRLESMNEFRAQLKDQAGTFVPRNEYDNQQHRLNEDVRILRETRASSEVSAAMLEKRLESMNEFRLQLKDQAGTFFTRNEHSAYMTSVEKDLRILRESKATLEGKATSLSVNISTTIAIIGVILAILSFFRGTFTVSESAQKPAITYPLPTK